ncbi:hemolysin activation/secretion protein [Burkholderiales bacterium JOSHI_001]|nr:hemolysin activation/secretion protein [Burkholderiales bacterium JOSHI_001]
MLTRLRRIAVACLWAFAGLAWGQDSAPAPQAEALRFDILEYVVEGNSVLQAMDIERAVMPFLGPGLGMAQVEAARSALEKAYQQAGWQTVFVDVPEQRVDSGVVRLVVLEGKVSRLQVSNARYISQGHIRAVVAELAEGTVPNFNRMQAQLAQVNRNEDRRVQPVLRPGTAPGTVEVDLKVTDRLPLVLSAEMNNRHAANTRPLRLSLSARYDNLFQREHGLALSFSTAPQQPAQSQVLTATYTIPEAGGAGWVVFGVLSDSEVEPLGATTVIGKGGSLGLRRQLPVLETAGGVHSLTLGADWKSTRQRIQSGADALHSPLRYLPLSLGYTATLSDKDSSTALNAALTFGLRGLLGRDVACPDLVVDQFECARHGADGGFASLRLDARHDIGLGEGWRLAGRLAGQLASQPLVSAEQFVTGGADTVRGYLEAEAPGDHGVLASLELRTPNLAKAVGDSVQDLTLLAFAEVSQVRLIDPLPGQAARSALASVGAGLRAKLAASWTAALDLALPIRRTTTTPERHPRVQFRLGTQY